MLLFPREFLHRAILLVCQFFFWTVWTRFFSYFFTTIKITIINTLEPVVWNTWNVCWAFVFCLHQLNWQRFIYHFTINFEERRKTQAWIETSETSPFIYFKQIDLQHSIDIPRTLIIIIYYFFRQDNVQLQNIINKNQIYRMSHKDCGARYR